MMKVYEIRKFGIDNLEVVERPQPTLKDDEVLIRVRAVSLNYRDLLVVKGIFNPQLEMPRIPMSDGAGEVVAVGKNVARFKVGDSVAGTFFQTWEDGEFVMQHHESALGGNIDGMFAEFVALNEKGLVRIPENLSFEEAAALPCAAVTAWNALFENRPVRSGESVLILGTGGVALFALQFARAAGARIFITSSSDEKLERAKRLGATEGINYRTVPNWGERVRELTDGRGVDYVVEIGGGGTFDQSVQALKPKGTISLLGVLTGFTAEVNIYQAFYRMATVKGVYVGSQRMFEEMNRAIEHNKIQPVIDKIFEFDQAPAAFRHLESGQHFGKVIVKVAS